MNKKNVKWKMTEIEEVPIENGEPVVAEVEAVVEPEAAPAPKKRGRPPGSKNRPKAAAEPSVTQSRASGSSKPKAPRSKPAPAPESDEEPPPPRRLTRATRQVEEPSSDSVSPGPPDTRAIAAEVLNLLSNRHVERAQAKREKYRSWFQ